MLPVDDVRDLMHQAMLGLTRMQIYTVISEAEISPDGKIAYNNFVPRAVGLIRSMLSFEKSIARETNDVGAEAEDNFFFLLDEAFAGVEHENPETFRQRLQQCNVMTDEELNASVLLLKPYGEEVPVEEAKAQIWALVKSMRRHKN